jgi:adenine-specific DNA-methyltransferase
MADGPRPYSGKLELTWTNKDRTLLAHEDGTYEWVDPADYRVSEVRLLQGVTTVGETKPETRRAADNLLIRGDALHALLSLTQLPEFAQHYAGQVRLVYIDPPFNTGQLFEDYDDNLEHSVWLTMLRDRLVQIKPLLAPKGSVWVHLDDAEVHRCRVVMDEVLGADNFVAEVIWEKADSPNNSARYLSKDQDVILV